MAEQGSAVSARAAERGFSVIEAVVGTMIAILAIVGLAHTFGLGRGMVDRYEIARAALGTAQRRMEVLTTRPPATLIAGADSTRNFVYEGRVVGVEHWTTAWMDARIDSFSPQDANPNDLKRVTVRVSWGSGVDADTIRLERVFPAS